MKMKPTDPAQRDVFDNGVRARTSNPETSKAAAASVTNVRASHKRILSMFRAYGDMTDETLAEYLADASRETGVKLMSPSGVRSRRSELSGANMARIEELVNELPVGTSMMRRADAECEARARLLIEGVRGPLWDTGKRETLASGRRAIVWGIAK